MKVLWLSPNFNHYKARFLNHLAQRKGIQLTVLAGSGRKGMGDQEIKGDWGFELKEINDYQSLGDDLFTFKINYNTIELSGGTLENHAPLYNGNISETIFF